MHRLRVLVILLYHVISHLIFVSLNNVLEKECINELHAIHYSSVVISSDWLYEYNYKMCAAQPGSRLVSRTRVKTLASETVAANARFFGGDLSKVPTMALTVGVGTVMDARGARANYRCVRLMHRKHWF